MKNFKFLGKFRAIGMSIEKIIFFFLCWLYWNERRSIRKSILFLILRKGYVKVGNWRIIVLRLIIVNFWSCAQIVNPLKLTHRRNQSSFSIRWENFNVSVGICFWKKIFVFIFDSFTKQILLSHSYCSQIRIVNYRGSR